MNGLLLLSLWELQESQNSKAAPPGKGIQGASLTLGHVWCCQMWRQQFQGLTTVPAVLMRQVQLAVLALRPWPVWRWPRAHHAHRLYLGGVATPCEAKLVTPASLRTEGAADQREYQYPGCGLAITLQLLPLG